MEKDKKEWEKKAKCVYVPPRIEEYEATPNNLLGISPQGDHMQGVDMSEDGGDHKRGIDGSAYTSNSTKILDREFSFSDVWEE